MGESVRVQALLLRLGFGNGFQIREAFFELAADHFVHAHEKADRFGDEILFPGHAPGDRGLIAFRFEGELGIARPGKRLHEIQFEPDQVVWMALDDGHAAFAHLTVTRPGENGACSRRRTLKGSFRRGIEFRPRGPLLKPVEIVHLGKHNGGRAEDGRAAHDPVFGWLQRGDDNKHDDDDCENEEDL
jgi:hypothetical protein